jgi:hypothetical protein
VLREQLVERRRPRLHGADHEHEAIDHGSAARSDVPGERLRRARRPSRALGQRLVRGRTDRSHAAAREPRLAARSRCLRACRSARGGTRARFGEPSAATAAAAVAERARRPRRTLD